MIKTSDYIVVETKVAKNNINKYLKINPYKIKVVGNTYNSFFNSYYKQIKGYNVKTKTFKLLTLSSFYSHKNLLIIKSVLKRLEKISDKNFIFYLTIDPNKFEKYFKKNI